MPYDGNGTFNPDPTSYPAVADTVILASKFNTLIADIAEALTVAWTRDGQAAASANQSMGGFLLRNLASGTVATDAATYGQLTAATALNETITSVAGTATTDLGAIASRFIDVTGNTGITSFGSAPQGTWRVVRFTGYPAITHSATLVLPGGADLTVTSGDIFIALSTAPGSWQVIHYQPYAGRQIQTCSFMARRSDRTTLLAIGTTSIPNPVYDQVQHNVGSGFAPSTGTFTAPATGYYHFDVVFNWTPSSGAPGTSVVQVHLAQSATIWPSTNAVNQIIWAPATHASKTVSYSVNLLLAAGQTVTPGIYLLDGGTLATVSTADAITTESLLFSGHRIP